MWADKKITIHEERIDLKSQSGDLYRINYDNSVTNLNPVELVLARAKCERDDQGKYGLLNNNCESYATYCKQGVSHSQQKVWFWREIKKALCYVMLVLIRSSLIFLIVSETVEEIIEVRARTKLHLTPCLAKYEMTGAALFLGFELVFFFLDWYPYWREWSKGNMYRRDYCKHVLIRSAEFLLRVTFGAACSIFSECYLVEWHYKPEVDNRDIALVKFLSVLSALVGVSIGELIKLVVCYLCKCGSIITKCCKPRDYRRINSLDELSPGVHITFKETYCSSYQHAVVLSVDLPQEEFKLVYYSRDSGHVENDYRFGSIKPVYKMWTTRDLCRNDEVAGRAVDMLRGEQQRLDRIREQNRVQNQGQNPEQNRVQNQGQNPEQNRGQNQGQNSEQSHRGAEQPGNLGAALEQNYQREVWPANLGAEQYENFGAEQPIRGFIYGAKS